MSPRIHLQTALAAPPTDLPGADDFRRWVSAALPPGRQGAEIGIRLVDEEESRRLNHTYRHKDRPTNILSFPYDPVPGVEAEFPLGDLVLCIPVVRREAAEQGKPLHAHLAHLTVHGTLHLLGYDHINEQEAATMEALEVEILAALGYPDPYQTTETHERRPT